MTKFKIITLFAIATLNFACDSEEQVDILSTTNIVADVVNNIKPPSLSLMGPGTDPHLYKSKSGDHLKMNQAKTIIYSGLHLEGKLTEALEHLSKQKTVVPLSAGIPESKLIVSEDFGGKADPHFWFDIDLMKLAVLQVSESLQMSFPEHVADIQNNTNRYVEKLDSTNESLEQVVNELSVEQRVLVTAHDAFGYFGKRYNFKVIGIQGASTASEAGLRDISNLVEYIVENKVPAIFVESSVSERNVNAIIEGCKNKNWDLKLGGTLYSDALGDENSPASNYLNMMDHNVNTIVSALKNSNE